MSGSPGAVRFGLLLLPSTSAAQHLRAYAGGGTDDGRPATQAGFEAPWTVARTPEGFTLQATDAHGLRHTRTPFRPESYCHPLGVTPANQSICAPANAVYTVNVGSLIGFTNAVTLAAGSLPANATHGFVPNPVTPPGASTLTVGNTGAVAPGSHTFSVSGSAIGSPGHATNVGLTLSLSLDWNESSRSESSLPESQAGVHHRHRPHRPRQAHRQCPGK